VKQKWVNTVLDTDSPVQSIPLEHVDILSDYIARRTIFYQADEKKQT